MPQSLVLAQKSGPLSCINQLVYWHGKSLGKPCFFHQIWGLLRFGSSNNSGIVAELMKLKTAISLKRMDCLSHVLVAGMDENVLWQTFAIEGNGIHTFDSAKVLDNPPILEEQKLSTTIDVERYQLSSQLWPFFGFASPCSTYIEASKSWARSAGYESKRGNHPKNGKFWIIQWHQGHQNVTDSLPAGHPKKGHPGASLAPPACEPRTGLPWLFAPPATRNQRQWVHMAWKTASLLAKEKVLQVDKFLSENWDVLLLQHFKGAKGRKCKNEVWLNKMWLFWQTRTGQTPHQRRGC